MGMEIDKLTDEQENTCPHGKVEHNELLEVGC